MGRALTPCRRPDPCLGAVEPRLGDAAEHNRGAPVFAMLTESPTNANTSDLGGWRAGKGRCRGVLEDLEKGNLPV
jgi:hypothetical protein